MSGRTFYITTAIPYANGAPHIGHAYERIATDAIARFKRLDGYDVLFVTGVDEHGLKMLQTAQREGITPLQLGDRTAAEFLAMGEVLEAPTDDFVRTTQERHKRASQAIWEGMQAAGDIYLSKYSGWYSVRDEAYYDEGELTAAADGGRLAPTGSPVEWVEEESYFFRLSAYADRLLRHYEEHPDFVTPEKYKNELVAFIKRGLSDLSISRTTFAWGVPVPNDPNHVMYVWVDALTNYITATGYPDPNAPRANILAGGCACDRQGHHAVSRDLLAGLSDVGRDCRAEAGRRPRFSLQSWRENVEIGRQRDRPVHACRALQHRSAAVFLPARSAVRPGRQLLARGDRAAGQCGSRQRSRQSGAAFAIDDRASNCEGRVPTPGEFTAVDKAILAEAYAIGDKARGAMRDFALHQVLAEIWHVVAGANRYFAAEEPWAKRKSDPDAHGDDPLCHRGGAARCGDLRAAVHAGEDGAACWICSRCRKMRAALTGRHASVPSRRMRSYPRLPRFFRAMSSRKNGSVAKVSV